MSQLTAASAQAPQTQAKASSMQQMLQRAAINPIRYATLQRCSNGVECASCRQKRLEREGSLQRAAINSAPTNTIPPIVHDVLNSSGQPLDASTRAFMEPRFGHDFSKVRVHTDDRAAESARAVNALAYTVGNDVVFGTGQYAPETNTGRMLMAHELVHVVQQRFIPPPVRPSTVSNPTDVLEQAAERTATNIESNKPVANALSTTSSSNLQLFRVCTPALCPPISSPMSATGFRWEAAEKGLQDHYRTTHPANSIGFNKEWLYLIGKNAVEKQVLTCMKPAFTARSGMATAEPDIFDFSNFSIHEITTMSGFPLRNVKLDAEVLLATRISSVMSCGGVSWSRGWWIPSPCYWMGGNEYIKVSNNNGVIVYIPVVEMTKEVLVAIMLATMASLLKKAGPKQAVARVAGRFPVLAAATVIILLASGAEVKAAPGEDPIEGLIKSLQAKGVKVPSELADFINSNPEVKVRVEAAAKAGGDPSEQKKALIRSCLDVVEANKDKLSREDLEALTDLMTMSSANVPGTAPTIQSLQNELERVKRGERPSDPASDAPATKEGGASTEKEGKAQGAEGKGTGGQRAKEEYPGISAEAAAKLAAASLPVRTLFELITTKIKSGVAGVAVTTQIVMRFLQIVPADFTSEDVKRIAARFAPLTGESADVILDQLAKGIADLRTKDAERAPKEHGAGNVSEGSTTTPSKSQQGTQQQSNQNVVQQIVANLGKVTWEKVKPDMIILGELNDIKVGESKTKFAYGLTEKNIQFGAIVTIKVRGRKDDVTTVFVFDSSPFVSRQGEIINNGERLIGRTFDAKPVQ